MQIFWCCCFLVSCRFAAKFEWGMTYLLVRDDRGIAPKDAIRGVFDGSFFEYMEFARNPRPHQY